VDITALAERPMSESKDRAVPGATLTVLVAEDDATVRTLIVRQLEQDGHRVLSAENGREAMLLAAQHQGVIDYLVTDYVMPWVSGPELVDALWHTRPETKVIFMSSFVPSADAMPELPPERVTFIAKPFTMSELKGVLAARNVN